MRQRLSPPLLLSMVLLACSSDADIAKSPDGSNGGVGGGAGGGAQTCTMGQTQTCVGSAACKGGQACTAQGTWSVCDCGAAGKGASGGSAGHGGTVSGSGGAAGHTGGAGGLSSGGAGHGGVTAGGGGVGGNPTGGGMAPAGGAKGVGGSSGKGGASGGGGKGVGGGVAGQGGVVGQGGSGQGGQGGSSGSAGSSGGSGCTCSNGFTTVDCGGSICGADGFTYDCTAGQLVATTSECNGTGVAGGICIGCPSGYHPFPHYVGLFDLVLGCVRDDDATSGCGPFRTQCPKGNAWWTCANDACVLDHCRPGFEDCDGQPSNGCEVDLATPAHCGTCGNVCGGSTPLCEGGVCVAACDIGFTSCGGMQCHHLLDDPAACGGCSTDCRTTSPHQTGVCKQGMCSLVCDPGYMSCGGQGCRLPAECPVCMGVGTFGAVEQPDCADPCPGDSMPCPSSLVGEACTDIRNDKSNCGKCGVVCPGVCVSGACQPAGADVIATSPTAISSSCSVLAQDDTHLYWAGSDAIYSVAKTGGTPTALAALSSKAGGLAVTGGRVFWSLPLEASIVSAPITGGGATFFQSATASRLQGDGSYLYWQASAGIQRAPLDGSPATTIVPASGGASNGYAVDSLHLFFHTDTGTSGKITRVNKDGSAPLDLFPTTDFVMADDGGLYGVQDDNAGGWQLYQLSKETPTPAASPMVLRDAHLGIWLFTYALTASRFFYLDGISSGSVIVKMNRCDYSAEIVDSVTPPDAIAADEDALYMMTGAVITRADN